MSDWKAYEEARDATDNHVCALAELLDALTAVIESHEDADYNQPFPNALRAMQRALHEQAEAICQAREVELQKADAFRRREVRDGQ